MLQRGFWLYVWVVGTPKGEYLYVGRTGDSASPNATSPYVRLGQHLGDNIHQNMLRKHLVQMNIQPESCNTFRLIAHGPIFPEGPKNDMERHKPVRDKIAALEKALAEALSASGYKVLNTVRSRMPIDPERFVQVRVAFSEHFPKLRN